VSQLAWVIAETYVKRSSAIVSKGILQGYRSSDVSSFGALRGQIRWSEQLRNHLGSFPPFELSVDELTEDVEENRILKAAGYVLVKCPIIRHRSVLLQGLNRVVEALSAVSFCNYSTAKSGRGVPLPPLGPFTPLNQYYKDALEVSYFILQNFSFVLPSAEKNNQPKDR
jgi:5-methylcytosine-specific restriction endonuclease McrBC regulatory subunit McrC